MKELLYMCVHGNFSAVTIMNYIITDDSVLSFHRNSFIYIYIYIVYCHENTQDVNFHVSFRKVVFLHTFLYRGSLGARWTTPKKCESFLRCSSLKFWASKFNIRFPKLFLSLSDDVKRVWGCTPCLLMHSFPVQIMRMFFKH